jgi:general secretion pathway protein A
MEKSVRDFYGLAFMPFSKLACPQNAFPSEGFKEACAQVAFGIGSEDFLLLTGPVGVGKSVVLAATLHDLDTTRYIPLYLRGNGLSEGELYKGILAGLDREPPRYTQNARRMFFSVVPSLTRKPIVAIDDAQEMKEAAMLSLKTLANFDTDSTNRITFILCGQPELKAQLKLAQFLPLSQRIRLFFHLKPMTLKETLGYIDQQTSTAGCPTPLFSDSAKADIHRLSDGVARVVNMCCYRSLINGAIKGVKIIDSSDVFFEKPSE